MEGEIYAIVDVIQEVLFLKKLIQEQHEKGKTEPIEIMEDNQGAIAFLNNNSTRGRSKHIDIRVFFVRDLVKTNEVRINREYCGRCFHETSDKN